MNSRMSPRKIVFGVVPRKTISFVPGKLVYLHHTVLVPSKNDNRCPRKSGLSSLYYRVIALISANIVPSWDIEGRELASVRRYPNEGQYSPISVR